MANFTTSGRGAADGCEITLAFVAAKPPAESGLDKGMDGQVSLQVPIRIFAKSICIYIYCTHMYVDIHMICIRTHIYKHAHVCLGL